MEYEIILKPSSRKDLDNLSEREVIRISERLFQIGVKPRPIGVQKLTVEEGYRIRIGNYRVLFMINDDRRKVFVYRIKHRKDAYR